MGDYYTRVVVDDGDGGVYSCLIAFVVVGMILKKQQEEGILREMKP